MWIDAKTPPKNCDPVLICNANCVNDYGYPYEVPESYDIAFYSKGKWYEEHGFDIKPFDDGWVTHWMDIKPPEKK